MRRLPLPNMDAADVYASCVSGITTQNIATRFTNQLKNVPISAQQYEMRARTHELYKFIASDRGNDGQLVLGDLTKGEFIDLYTDQLSNRRRPGRDYYDRLMRLAPLGKCPFCGFGHVSTLDHFLPKSRYPLFSVLPANLVPCCADCNKGKGFDELSEQGQIPHPYFADECIEKDCWLSAVVNETTPVTATFHPLAPAHWADDLKRRVFRYFHDFKLASRFAVEAASELTSLSDFLGQLQSSDQIGRHLRLTAQTECAHRRNSWKAALYEALSRSTWYSEGGFRRTPPAG